MKLGIVDPTGGNMFEGMIKKLKKEFGFLNEDETEDNSGVEDNVLQQLDRSEKLDDIDTVTFGLETDDGKIVKVYVQADQSTDFEKALAAKLGEVDDIETVLNELSKEFEIVDVEWPDDDKSDETDDDNDDEGNPETDGSEVMNKKVYDNKEEKSVKDHTAKMEDLDLGERVSLSLTEGTDGGSVEERLTTATQLLVYHALLELGIPEIAINKSPYKSSIVHGIKHRAAEIVKDTALKASLKVFVAKATHSKPDPDAVEAEDDQKQEDDDKKKSDDEKNDKKDDGKKSDEPKKSKKKRKDDEPKKSKDEEPPKEEDPPKGEEPPKDEVEDEPVEPPKDDEEGETSGGKKKVKIKGKPKFMESLMTLNEGIFQDYWDGMDQLLTYVSASPQLLDSLRNSTQYKALVTRSQRGITMNVKFEVRRKLNNLTKALSKVNPEQPEMVEGISPDTMTSLIEDLFNMADPTPNKSLATALFGSPAYKTFMNRAKPKLSLKFNGSMRQLLVQLSDTVSQSDALQKPVNNEPKPAVKDNAPLNATQESIQVSGSPLTESLKWSFTMGDDDNAVISCEQLKFALDPESLEKAIKALEVHSVIVLKDAIDPKTKITISPRGINAVIKKAGGQETYPMSSDQIKEFTEFAIRGAEGKEQKDKSKGSEEE